MKLYEAWRRAQAEGCAPWRVSDEVPEHQPFDEEWRLLFDDEDGTRIANAIARARSLASGEAEYQQ